MCHLRPASRMLSSAQSGHKEDRLPDKLACFSGRHAVASLARVACSCYKSRGRCLQSMSQKSRYLCCLEGLQQLLSIVQHVGASLDKVCLQSSPRLPMLCQHGIQLFLAKVIVDLLLTKQEQVATPLSMQESSHLCEAKTIVCCYRLGILSDHLMRVLQVDLIFLLVVCEIDTSPHSIGQKLCRKATDHHLHTSVIVKSVTYPCPQSISSSGAALPC